MAVQYFDTSPSAENYRTNRLTRAEWLLLFVIVIAAFAIRLAAWRTIGTGTIEFEGAEYATLAKNLRAGVGYVGIVLPGPQVHFPPLFPWLIAGTSFLTNNYELSGRVISLIMGALLPLPVFGIAARLFNRPVGFIAAALTCLFPLSIYLSFMVLSEGPYATLLLSTLWLVVRTVDRSTAVAWLCIGIAFGVCYLMRAEAVLPFAISLFFGLVATGGRLIVRIPPLILAVAAFLLVALPEVMFIHGATGKFALETKSTNLGYMARRILALDSAPGVEFVSSSGLRDVPSPALDKGGDSGNSLPWDVKWAYYGIDDQLNDTGSVMRPWAEIARDEKVSLGEMIRVLRGGIIKNLPVMYNYFSSGWLGAPLLPALALLGALRRPWRRPQASSRLFIALVAVIPLASQFLVLWYADPRYYFIFVPFLCIWAGNGLFETGLWVRASLRESGWNWLARWRIVQWAMPVLVGALIVVTPIKKVRALYEFANSAPESAVDRKVGEWIGGLQPGPIKIMDQSLPLSFHAGAVRKVYFPYSTGDLALRYLDKAKIDYIVLRRAEEYTRYYEEWLTKGIPSPRAERLVLPDAAANEKFVIYRWHPAAS